MLWFEDISFWNRSFEDYLMKNSYPPNFIDSLIKSFLNKLYTKVIVQNVPKRNVFVKLRLFAVLRFKFERSFKRYLMINWRLLILKSFLRHPSESKTFWPSRISYLRCYFKDFFTNISVVAAKLPIIVRPNAILNYKFVNI